MNDVVGIIQRHNIHFFKGRPPQEIISDTVEKSIVSGKAVMGIPFSENEKGIVTGIAQPVRVYVDVASLSQKDYLVILHELVELGLVEKVIKEKPITYGEYEALVNNWYSDLMTWLLVSYQADKFKLGDDERFEAAFQAAFHIFAMLLVEVNHPKLHQIFSILRGSQLDGEFRAVYEGFRKLALRREVQVKFGELLQKFYEEYQGDFTKFSSDDKQVVLGWVKEFFSHTNVFGARMASNTPEPNKEPEKITLPAQVTSFSLSASQFYPTISRIVPILREALTNRSELKFEDVPAIWEEALAKNFSLEEVVEAIREWSTLRGGSRSFYLGFGYDLQGFPELFFDLALHGAIGTLAVPEQKARIRAWIRDPNENKDVREYVGRPFVPLAIEEDVQDLVYMLQNPDIFSGLIRREASEKLGEFGEKAKSAVPALIQTLVQAFQEERVLQDLSASSLEAIMRIDSNASIPFTDEKGQEALVPARQVTISLLSDSERTTRWNAVNVAVAYNHPTIAETLLKRVYEEPDADLRAYIVNRLSRPEVSFVGHLRYLALDGQWNEVGVQDFNELIQANQLMWHVGIWHEVLSADEIEKSLWELNRKKDWQSLEKLFWKVAKAAETLLTQPRVDLNYTGPLVGWSTAIDSVLNKADQKNPDRQAYLEKLTAVLGRHYQSSEKDDQNKLEGARLAVNQEEAFDNFVIETHPKPGQSIAVSLKVGKPSILTFKEGKSPNQIDVYVGGEYFKTVNTTQKIKDQVVHISVADMIGILRGVNQKYNREVAPELQGVPIEAYIHLNSYKGLPENLQESMITSELGSIVARRANYKAIHLVGDDYLVKKANAVIDSVRSLESKRGLFVTGDAVQFQDANQVHILTKDYFLANPDLRKDPKRRFVTLDNIHYDQANRTVDVVAFNPVVSFMEMIGTMDNLSKEGNTFSLAYEFFKQITGYDITRDEFLGFLQGNPDLVKRFALPPAIRAIDINLALRVWAIGARMAAQAA